MECVLEGPRTPRGQLNVTGTLAGKRSGKKDQDSKRPKAGAYTPKQSEATVFRRFYDRSDLPVAVDNYCMGIRLKWKVEVDKLDYHHYLPLFFEGLRETKEPYATIATLGTKNMLEHGDDKVLNVVPQLIIPMKKALDTKNPIIMIRTIKAIQQLLLTDDLVGEALVPYYRQILPILNTFKHKNVNTGDGIYYGQSANDNLGDLISDTLQMLERQGGDDAYINIKYMVPTYESCIMN